MEIVLGKAFTFSSTTTTEFLKVSLGEKPLYCFLPEGVMEAFNKKVNEAFKNPSKKFVGKQFKALWGNALRSSDVFEATFKFEFVCLVPEMLKVTFIQNNSVKSATIFTAKEWEIFNAS